MSLIVGKSYLFLFVGWEGIGVVSFLLISFWQTRNQAVQASIQAIVLNRIGDIALVLSLVTIFTLARSWELSLGDFSLGLGNLEVSSLVVYLSLIAAAGKSAQIGLHAWLPNAIEAPTPISALIHAATLVTAGVYLLVRLSGGITHCVQPYCYVLGASTLVFAGFMGLTQTDLKRVIAFSTISQVGYLILGCGWEVFNTSLFILLTHAFYKSLLFLGAGGTIHATGNLQEIRNIGGLGLTLPGTKVLFMSASLALGACPFTSGEWTKDFLVELGGSSQAVFRNVCWLLAVLGIGLTAYYSSRLFRLVFSNAPKGASLNSQHEIPNPLILCLIVLGAISVTAGWLLSDLFTIGIQRNGDSLLPYQYLIIKVELEIDPYTLNLPLLFNGIGIAAGVNTVIFIQPKKRYTLGFNLSTISQTLGGWDVLTAVPSVINLNRFSSQTLKTVNAGTLELAGSQGLSTLILDSSPKNENTLRGTIGILVAFLVVIVWL